MRQNAPPQHILVIRPSALGDVCRTVPVLASLRAAYPQALIDWVVRDDFAAAIEAHPALNEIIQFPRSRFAHWWRNPGRALELWRWFAGVRGRGYDLVLDCQGLGRSGLMTAVSGAKQRVGLRKAREFAWLGYNIRAMKNAQGQTPIHTVDQMLTLVEAIGVEPIADMRLYLSTEHQNWWKQQRDELKFTAGKYAVLAPTARWLSKRWPIERFAQLIEPLHQRGYVRIVVIGSSNEVEQVKPLVDKSPRMNGVDFVVDLVGKTSIGQTMAVIGAAGLVIANDSAPLHMAVGFDRPCVALFGPTNPSEVGPYQRPETIVRGYSPGRNDSINYRDSKVGDSLMRFISTTAVIQQMDRVLGGWIPAEPTKRAKLAGGEFHLNDGVEVNVQFGRDVVEGAAS